MADDEAMRTEQHAPVIRVENETDHTVVVTITGDIDLYLASVLDATLAGTEGQSDVVVDCADVQFMDSTGLSVLLGHLQRIERAGGSLRLRHPSDPVRYVVEVAGLTNILLPRDD